VVKPYYADDYVTLYHGDCHEVGQWLALGDVMVTDPPYGIGWQRGNNPRRNSKPHAGIVNDEDTKARDRALELWGDERPAVMFGSFYAPFPQGVKQVLVWRKPADSGVVGSTMGYRRDVEPVFIIGPWPRLNVAWSSLLQSRRGSINAVAVATGHPHTKPLDVIQAIIDRCPPGVIADPFAGSGTTLVAAKCLGRKAIGVEIEERYCEIAARRLSQDVLDFGESA
jgi:site-specific DNA-methyltransferase (adenine-specific)